MGLSALCPGTFDPVTNGHLDIIQRASRCFGTVVVAALSNPGKEPLFTLDERVAMLKEAVGPIAGAEVDSFSGLLVDFAKDRGPTVIVKGLRAVTDFDFELQMAQMNQEVVRFGGDVSGLVPGFVRERLEEKLARRSIGVD